MLTIIIGRADTCGVLGRLMNPVIAPTYDQYPASTPRCEVQCIYVTQNDDEPVPATMLPVQCPKSPLKLAMDFNDEDMVCLLITQGADVTLIEDGYNATQRACMTG